MQGLNWQGKSPCLLVYSFTDSKLKDSWPNIHGLVDKYGKEFIKPRYDIILKVFDKKIMDKMLENEASYYYIAMVLICLIVCVFWFLNKCKQRDYDRDVFE